MSTDKRFTLTKEQITLLLLAAFGKVSALTFEQSQEIADRMAQDFMDEDSTLRALVYHGAPDPAPEAKVDHRAFEQAARPLMQWLAENVHPHHMAVVVADSAELLEGKCSTGHIPDYIKG